MYVFIHEHLKKKKKFLCVCAHLVNKADSDSDILQSLHYSFCVKCFLIAELPEFTEIRLIYQTKQKNHWLLSGLNVKGLNTQRWSETPPSYNTNQEETDLLFLLSVKLIFFSLTKATKNHPSVNNEEKNIEDICF